MGKIKSELQHIHFPNKKEIIKNTAATLCIAIVSALILFEIQTGIAQLIKLVL